MERKRRLPSVERYIKDISEEDFRVRILGMVVDVNKDNYSVMLDDGTGRAVVQFVDPELFNSIKGGMPIRVIGKVVPGEDKIIDAEVVQDMSKLDFGLYNQVRYISENLLEAK